MSFIPVVEYLGGLAFFGFIYWLIDGIKDEIQGVSETGNLYDLAGYVWIGIIFIYLIFGGVWVVRVYAHRQYREG